MDTYAPMNTSVHTNAAEASSPTTVPRWEWRVFEHQQNVIVPVMAAATSQSSNALQEETYILSWHTQHNVKIRSHRLQVKHLERVDTAGLEQWRPVLDVSFPVRGGQLHAMCTALGIPMSYNPNWEYTRAELLARAMTTDPTLRTVDVTKTRTAFTLGQCRGEHATVTVKGAQWYTLAFEDVDSAIVYSVVQHFGLEHRRNTSYPAWLKHSVGVFP